MNRRSFIAYVTAAAATLALPRGMRASVAPAVAAIDAMLRPVGFGGVCVPPQAGAETMMQALNLLQPAIWHSYGMWPDVTYPGRIPMIYDNSLFDRKLVRDWLTNRPGLTWMLLNEPERPDQSDTTWQQAVAMTLEIEALARSVGNEYQLCSPAVCLGNTDHDGLAWLTDLMTHLRRKENHWRYAYWCVHPYPSSNVSEFRASWNEWRSWYAVWGSGAPVVLSEVCAQNSALDEQIAVMDEAKTLFSRGEVCGVFWFAAHAGAGMPWSNAALTSADGSTLTELGRHWKALQL